MDYSASERRHVDGSCEDGNEPSDSIKFRKIYLVVKNRLTFRKRIYSTKLVNP